MEEEEGVPGRTVVFKPGVLSEELLPEEKVLWQMIITPVLP